MIFKRFSQLATYRDPTESFTRRICRYTMAAAILLAVFAAFWKNSENLWLKNNSQQHAVIDDTGLLDNGQMAQLQQYSRLFYTTYGVPLRIRIADQKTIEAALKEAVQNNVVCICIDPKRKQVALHAPALVRAALGEAMVHHLSHEHFIPYFNDGNWPTGLADALTGISRKLDTVLLSNHE